MFSCVLSKRTPASDVWLCRMLWAEHTGRYAFEGLISIISPTGHKQEIGISNVNPEWGGISVEGFV
jgi:hypothetical protein